MTPYERALAIEAMARDLVAALKPAAPPATSTPAAPAAPAGGIEAHAADHYQRVFPGTVRRISAGPRDTLRPGPAVKPWTLFEDPDTLTLAMPAAQGAADVDQHWQVLPVYGTRNYSSYTTPALIGGKFRQLYGESGDDPAVIRQRLETGQLATQSGPRGQGIWTAYTTWHCHVDWAQDADGKTLEGVRSANPRVPFAIGVTVDGWICRATKDGGIYYDARLPVEPQSYYFDFTYFDPDRSLQFFADGGTGRVIKTRHTPRVPQAFTHEVFAEGFGRPTSIRAIGSLLYLADADTGRVWELDASTGARRVAAVVPDAWWIDHTSDGKLVVMDLAVRCHIIDPATGNVEASITPYDPPQTGRKLWVQCSVDRAGTCGPRDSILMCASHGAGNVDVYLMTRQGARRRFFGVTGNAVVGPAAGRMLEVCHYPWVVEFHPTQAVMLLHGFAEMCPTILVNSKRKFGDWDHDRARRGRQAWDDGGAPDVRGKVPSFSCQAGGHGWSFGFLTFDHLAEMPVADAAAFLRAGGLGSVPRDIPTETMRDLLYYVRYNSAEHCHQAAKGTAGAWLRETLAIN